MMADDALKQWLDEELPEITSIEAVFRVPASRDYAVRVATAAYRAGDAAGVKRTLERVAQYYESVCMDATAIEIRQMKP